ncbi:TonB-dependent receptor [Leptolyngbya sp. 7M]|uniref:TonB-dependent receptor n=1 Tax=Leptolyngbya sp. 7M TaxID=2812896 RepID=UPI001B8C43E3|nr:carboxypeptidase-like regulatory domain-containing protein [Leptolyngbya sp. 7M]QYO66673.1 carboxypeptidase-like regulatory domain-containing protein [Leptolyngbya sp. 7M]
MFAVILFASTTFAQSGTTSVSGTVTDQNGAVVAGATVVMTNAATGLSRTVVTNEVGRYSFASVQPATYRIEVTASGFKKAQNNNVQALVDTPNTANFSLEPGDVSVTVDVTTSTIESLVNTQDASIGNTFVPEQITQLPTDLRRVNDLLNLQPGVTRDGYVAGGRSDQANITLDGVDINDQQTGGRSGSFDLTLDSALRATSESVQEFRITTVGANANQGRSSGAQISLITRSGTNDFRGAVFYFYRPTAFSANTFFNNLAGVERPSIARSVYGGRIGGPIVRNKFFFFYSYEGQYQKQDASVNRTVPLAHLGQGVIRFNGSGPSCSGPQRPGGNCAIGLAELNSIYSAAGINPIAVATLNAAATRYASNNTIVGDGFNTGGFLFNSPTTDKENTHIARLDYNVNSKHQLFFRGNYQWDTTAGISAFPDTPATSLWSHPYGFVVGHNWTISTNRFNNLRYGLTRQAFSSQGDSSANNISFRFIFSPLLFARTLDRITPVQNITNDFTWIKGNHTVQIGGNVRIIRNQRRSFALAYDAAVTNPSFYASSGAVVNQQITNAGYTIASGSVPTVQAAATALIGRYSQYSGNFTFDIDGSVLPSGTPSARTFATEEYDGYIQDAWKVHRTLTLTMGLRYGVSRPVYEQNGFQVVPTTRLGEIFERRKASAAVGIPLNELVFFQLGGPKNSARGFYSMDWNNLQPSIAAAWTPNIGGKVGRFFFGNEGDSVLRGGFRMLNDYFGGQLAVSFDGLSAIGFTSSTTISANTYNVTTNLAPLFTGFNQDIRALPGIPAPLQRFSQPADEQQRIESSLDGTIVSPTHYTWNASFGRSLPKGMYIEASYLGRSGRKLFGARDIFALNNLVDPVSGMDYYTAMGLLVDARRSDRPINSLAPIPFWENLFPGARTAFNIFGIGAQNNTQAIYALIARTGFDIDDYTFVQLLIDDIEGFRSQTGITLPNNPGILPNMFYHPQYAALSAFGTFANSDYHGGTVSFRQRLGETLTYDFNYTFSKSMDDVSGLQTDGSYGGQFLLNPLRQRDSYGLSDFCPSCQKASAFNARF